MKENVARGYAWLQANRADRIADIDLDSLWLASPSDCVLGQTGGYDKACRELFPVPEGADFETINHVLTDRDQWAEDHGFFIRYNGNDIYDLYTELTAEWRKVLA